MHSFHSPGKTTGAGSYSLLQGIFLTHESNPHLLRCRQILYCLSYQGSLISIMGLAILSVTFLCFLTFQLKNTLKL